MLLKVMQRKWRKPVLTLLLLSLLFSIMVFKQDIHAGSDFHRNVSVVHSLWMSLMCSELSVRVLSPSQVRG